jgi:hypothetical protein
MNPDAINAARRKVLWSDRARGTGSGRQIAFGFTS